MWISPNAPEAILRTWETFISCSLPARSEEICLVRPNENVRLWMVEKLPVETSRTNRVLRKANATNDTYTNLHGKPEYANLVFGRL
jgi:hypothetical protein